MAQLKANGSEMCEKRNNSGVDNPELASVLVSRLDTNVKSTFSITSFGRTDTASITRLDAEVELTLSLASFTIIDAVSAIRLDANIESMFLSAS